MACLSQCLWLWGRHSLLIQVPKYQEMSIGMENILKSEHGVEDVSWICFFFPPASFSSPSSLTSSLPFPSLRSYINPRAGHPAASTAEQCLGRVHVDTSALYPEGSTAAFFFLINYGELTFCFCTDAISSKFMSSSNCHLLSLYYPANLRAVLFSH